MTKNKLKVPCKCGHSRINHIWRLLESYNVCGVYECECDNYNPDNLKYLENEYERNHISKD